MLREDESFLKSLLSCDGHIVPHHHNRVYPVYAGGNCRRRPVQWVEKTVSDRLLQQRCLEPKRQFLRVSRHTRKFLTQTPSEPEGQVMLQSREIYTPDRIVRPVPHNRNTSILTRLSRKIGRDGDPYFNPAEIEAGAQFARDYALGGVGALHGTDYGVPRVDQSRKPDMAETLIISQIDRRRRYNEAVACLGPLEMIVTAVCCDNRPLEDVERVEKWAKQTGLTVLKLALGQLVTFYGTSPGQPL